MVKFLKVGRVAIITRGRYAGKKVVIIQPLDSGSKSHAFPHALVAGIERYPSQVTRRMSKARQAKRSRVKPFIKIINYNHLMPTRYTLELEGLKNVITNDTFKEVSQREEAKKTVKKSLEERYTTGKNRWFFTPLRESTLSVLDVLPFIGLRIYGVFDRDANMSQGFERCGGRWACTVASIVRSFEKLEKKYSIVTPPSYKTIWTSCLK
ncbi:MAG: hypothetical protein Q9197_002458 [Variospora fuerteventurae]